jgi:hypothetical protein
MATSSVQYENYADAIAFGIGFANQANSDTGKLRVAWFDVQTAASAIGEVLSLCVVPQGAKFVAALIAFEGTGSLTLNVGDSGDEDRLVAAADLGSDVPTTGGVLKLFGRIDSTAFGTAGPGSNTSTAISVGLGYKWTANTVITATTAGAQATAGEVIRGAIIYTVE